MSAWERWTFSVLAGVGTVTGLVYLWMKYGMTSLDPFAVVNHPWQPAMLSLHVVSAPALILVFGIVFRSHILGKLFSAIKPNRRSGWLSLASFAVMAASGYLLQVAAHPVGIEALVVAHVASSLVFVAGFGTHLVIGFRLSRATAPRCGIAAEVAEPWP